MPEQKPARPVIDLDEVEVDRPPMFQRSCRASAHFPCTTTMLTPETVEYPDSGKVALLSRQTAADGSPRMVRHIARAESSIDYRDGE